MKPCATWFGPPAVLDRVSEHDQPSFQDRASCFARVQLLSTAGQMGQNFSVACCLNREREGGFIGVDDPLTALAVRVWMHEKALGSGSGRAAASGSKR